MIRELLCGSRPVKAGAIIGICLADPKALALFGGNIALCLLFAAFVPMQELPHV